MNAHCNGGNVPGGNEREREDANIEATTSICAFGKNRIVADLQKHPLLLPYFPKSRCYFSIPLLLSNSTNKQILDNHSVIVRELHLSMKGIIVLFISDCPSKAGCDSGHGVTPLAEHTYWPWHIPADPISSPSSPASQGQPPHGQPRGRREAGKLRRANAALKRCTVPMQVSKETAWALLCTKSEGKGFQGRRLGEGSAKQLRASQWKRSLNVRKQKSETKNAQLINTTQVGNTAQAQWQGKVLQKWGQMRKQDLEF